MREKTLVSDQKYFCFLQPFLKKKKISTGCVLFMWDTFNIPSVYWWVNLSNPIFTNNQFICLQSLSRFSDMILSISIKKFSTTNSNHRLWYLCTFFCLKCFAISSTWISVNTWFWFDNYYYSPPRLSCSSNKVQSMKRTKTWRAEVRVLVLKITFATMFPSSVVHFQVK